MEACSASGPIARDGRTRLSIIYTGFLGDNENILFWVSQFLSEALRFCQRNPNDELQAVVMFDEADLYIPANAKPATAEPLQSLLKRARSAGLGIMLATQSPGDLDYKSRDQITSWFIGRVREDTALRKLKAAFQSESGLDPAAVLPGQTVGEFHLVQEGLVRSMKAQRSLIEAEQVPFDRIEQLAPKPRARTSASCACSMRRSGRSQPAMSSAPDAVSPRIHRLLQQEESLRRMRAQRDLNPLEFFLTHLHDFGFLSLHGVTPHGCNGVPLRRCEAERATPVNRACQLLFSAVNSISHWKFLGGLQRQCGC